MIEIENNYIKSPLNYVGGKYKLLPQILPLFPDNINVFFDMFGGGFNVGINVNAKSVMYNDIQYQIPNLFIYIKYARNVDYLLEEIDNFIKKYNLSRTNKEGYLKAREDYNRSDIKNPMLLYTLICHSFSNQIRFNKHDEFNLPFGKRTFNSKMRDNFIKFCNKIIYGNYDFFSVPFIEIAKGLDIQNCDKEHNFIYCDPPYLNSTASYNENGGWTVNDEKDLLNFLDRVNSNHIKFALSNNLKYENPILKKWINKYNVHYLEYSYKNCNYQKKDKGNDIEILVTNY